jgi:hypothetical protein
LNASGSNENAGIEKEYFQPKVHKLKSDGKNSFEEHKQINSKKLENESFSESYREKYDLQQLFVRKKTRNIKILKIPDFFQLQLKIASMMSAERQRLL